MYSIIANRSELAPLVASGLSASGYFPARQSPSRALTIIGTLFGKGMSDSYSHFLGLDTFELATLPDEQCQLHDEIYSVQAPDRLDDTATVNFDEFPSSMR